MTILIIVSVIFLVLLAGMLLAFLFTRMSHAVTDVQAEMASEERAYNPGVTLGHRIKVESDYEEQLKQARLEAAKAAAALPRGGNYGIGRDGQSMLSTAGKNIDKDPITAVRIARFHGWDGARSGAPSASASNGGVAPAAAAPAVAVATAPAAPAIAPPVLIEITSSMSPEEVRKARVANAKAQSAYNKALKAAASGAPVAAPVAVGVAPAAAAAPAAAPVVNIAPPTLIEITDSMSPEEVRKARVANAKAQSAYNRALKAAGVDPAALKAGTVAAPAAAPIVAPAVEAPAALAPAAVAPAASAVPAGIAPPKLIEITDDMSPEDKRQARVANAKAQSAYNKALKAAGIDPASLKK